MANDPIFDELNLTTLKEIYPRVVEDNFFNDSPFLAYLRANCLVPFGGGSGMQNTFLYRPMIGGFYLPGANWNISKVQTIAGTVFDPKYLEVAVPEYKEMLQVSNKGPNAVFSLIELDLKNAINTANAITAVSMARHGQPSGTGISDNRFGSPNGWVEAMNDGKTPGWDGNYFTAYGTQPRNGVVGSVLNTVPLWCGDQLGNPGPITYNFLEESYQDCSIGKEEPNLGVGTKLVLAGIKERIMPQQRFAQEADPVWGVQSIRMNNAHIMKDDYFPSAKYGKNDPIIGNYLTSTFASGTGFDASSNLPASTTCTVGEVFCWFNTTKILFRISDDPEYGYGFSGFVPAQDNSKVVGHVKAMVNLEFVSSRMHKQLYGING
jgi:hypothetical protein